MPEQNADIGVRNEGTIFLFDGRTEAGKTWLEENLDPEGQRFGLAYVVEHGYARDIAEGAIADGLVLV